MTLRTRDCLGIEQVIGDRHDHLLEIAARHGAMHVREFGSVACGEATEESDLDLLVTWDFAR